MRFGIKPYSEKNGFYTSNINQNIRQESFYSIFIFWY